jgi:hypothetical protein
VLDHQHNPQWLGDGAVLVEVNESGRVVWSVQTERIPYEADRLPVGESVGAVQYTSDGGSVESPDSDEPGISLLLVGLRPVVPSRPFGFRKPQLGLTLVSALLVVGNGIDHRRT